MNAPHPLIPAQGATYSTQVSEEEIDLLEYWHIVVDNRWLIAAVTALALLAGTAYALLSRPVYQGNLLIQVEDSTGSATSLLGEAASLFDVKTPATAEVEIIRSRMVLGQAVDSTLLFIQARPRYLPVVGRLLARYAKGLSDPGLLGLGGFVTGTEAISVQEFNVPRVFEGERFILTALGNNRFELRHPDLDHALVGTVGEPSRLHAEAGSISLTVTKLQGKPGAQFELVRESRLGTIEELQENLSVAEKGRQSGVIEVSLESKDPNQLTSVLHEIGQAYVRQNVERKAAEAQKTLAFLDVQLPQFKKQLDQAEDAYSRYRNKQGTVALDEEAKLILMQSVDLHAKLLEAQQKRRELVSRFTAQHPTVQTLDTQIAAWNSEIAKLNKHVRNLPTVQQDALRLERDVKVNNELYQQLRNNALQLQLVREGKIGNVRLIDDALLPEEPVKPRKGLVLGAALIAGLLSGMMIAVARNAFYRGIRTPQEIEAETGLSVYSTIPLSAAQLIMQDRAGAKEPGLHVLAHFAPDDLAVESLRSLRTAMQFAMLEASNNVLLVTGATPGVGKSFVSVNFAAVLASAGKRVLLIDADLRRGHLNQFFGTDRGTGLSELIAGAAPLDEGIRRDVLTNLDVITTGALPPNPAEMVMSRAFSQLLDQLSRSYEFIIIDTAPVLAAADTLSVSLLAGTRLLVARAGETQIAELSESAKRLQQAGASVTGVLFNAMDISRRHYGSYGYRYGTYVQKQYGYQAAKPR